MRVGAVYLQLLLVQELSGRSHRETDLAITCNALQFCGKYFYRNPPTG
jgi:hypothetical protein